MFPSRSWKLCVSASINLSFLIYLALRSIPSFSNIGNNPEVIPSSRGMLRSNVFHKRSIIPLEPILPAQEGIKAFEYSKDGNLTNNIMLIEPIVMADNQLERYVGLNKTSSYEEPKLFPCDDFTPHRFIGQRGKYYVLYNYFKATKTFGCDQSITYTTHSDWTFLDNLFPLLERWQGPVSLTLYTPGSDFEESLKRIQYLRECTSSSLVKELVTFHLFFDQHHIPKMKVPRDPHHLPVNCTELTAAIAFGEEQQTYKKLKNLLYPINVGRNVAKDMSTTHFVFPSDIELYPNPNLIQDFMEMIWSNSTLLQGSAPKVFVLSLFELDASVTVLPNDKRDLVHLIRNNSAIPFHQHICPDCHTVPKAEEWLDAPLQPVLGVFHVAKRQRSLWEPLYIGTKFDPMYDERLYWEGMKDKMVQSYLLCVLDYEFYILDNAFLVHRPGIKGMTHSSKKIQIPAYVSALQYAFISIIILPELKQIYGTRAGCDL